ncbi:LuxR family transcriptional regulator [Dactylosporangium sp. NPDC005555]|uniref:LuxR family transcriptional regulator n=1 Tax=Dactylosporangium sp. NPDC005555 TaxID=3154889 RepID=UPI0033B7834C
MIAGKSTQDHTGEGPRIVTARDAELRELKDAFKLGQSGCGTVILLSGSVGMGKTALVNTFLTYVTHDLEQREDPDSRDAAEAGPLVLTASCSFAERALPLSVIKQLFGSPQLPAEDRAMAATLLSNQAVAGHRLEDDPCTNDVINAWQAEVAQGLLDVLLGLVGRRCVVIAVNDFEHVDSWSLHVMMYLLVRISTARVVVVLNESTGARPRFQALRSEILRQPYARHIRLLPLTREGVVTMVGESLSGPATAELAGPLHEISGGNPLLLRALIDDCARSTFAGEVPGVVVADAFGDAVIRLLRRYGAEAVRATRILAVLEEPPPLPLLARLLANSVEVTGQLVDRLDAAGLLAGRRFRHPMARAAVLRDCQADELTGMREHVALVLHRYGAPTGAVLAQLLAAGCPAAPWATDLLRREARKALDTEDYEIALSYLELVGDQAVSPQERTEIDALRAIAEWRLHPSEVTHRFPGLPAAVRKGHLPDREAVAVVRNMLWYGRYDAATEAIRALADRSPCSTEQATFFAWLACTYPGLLPGLPSVRTTEAPTAELRAADLLGDLLLGRRTHDSALEADYLLRSSSPVDAAHYPMVSALEVLIYAGHLDAAERWCAGLMDNAARVRSSIGTALVSSLRAEAALRQGDLPAAVRHAGFAMSALSPAGWGVRLGAPLHCLIAAHTAMGELDEAARLVQCVPPRGVAETRFGLLYWHARGQFYLATGQVHAAIEDFQVCGDTMRRWGMDRPNLVPWRTDLAQALLRAGKVDRARVLAEAQLELADVGGGPARGVALRVLAAASSAPGRRLALLTQAVEALEDCGDTVELARALNELSETHFSMGKASRARVLARRARRIAETSRLHLGGRSAVGEDPPRLGTAHEAAAVADETLSLTEAERRVAVLAAQGYTNREVGQKLFVSVSTVEQHLSRVYRKLKVKRRAELAARFQRTLANSRISGVRAMAD